MMAGEGLVVVFARAPELGRVKTRLAAALGDGTALALHRAFLQDTLAAARAAGARVVLAHTASGPFPEQRLADGCVVQRGEGFAARFDAALADAAGLDGAAPLVVVGSDAPQVGPAMVRRALDALREVPAVLGPCSEGGFYLLGFAAAPVPVAEAFAGPHEAARATRLLRDQGLAPRLLEATFDVDVPGDLVHLLLHLELLEAAGGPWIPPATTRAVHDLGLQLSPGPGGANRGWRLEPRPARPAPTAP